MSYPRISPQATVARCTCRHRHETGGRCPKYFRDLPGATETPCPAHGRASA